MPRTADILQAKTGKIMIQEQYSARWSPTD